MRFLTTIFAFVFFSMMLAPCQDMLDCGDVHGDEITHNTNHHQDGEDHSGADNCSPFCACHCCHTHVIPTEIIENKDFITFTPPVLFYKTTNTKSIVHSLWRPPWV